MKLNLKLSLLLAFLIFPSVSPRAQTPSQVQSWLTTVDRTALFARQAALSFSESKSPLITIDVNDQQRFQTIDGFGVALTGGSAELLMRMASDRRAALLRELFASNNNDISISYLRITIGASDMNSRVYSYDDVPE